MCQRPIAYIAAPERPCHQSFQTTDLRMRGQDCFLAHAEVLQDVLLPRLSAVDLLRLGATCTGVLSWILNTPPSLWQVSKPDLSLPKRASAKFCRLLARPLASSAPLTCYGWQKAPRDAAAAHLASLPSIKLVLSALQKAFSARQRIQAKCPPVREVDVQLYDQRAGPHLQPGYKWCSMWVKGALLSPCESYIAVVLAGTQSPLDSNQDRRRLHVHDVCLHIRGIPRGC